MDKLKNIKLLNDNILIEQIAKDKTASGALYLPQDQRYKHNEGYVRAVGQGVMCLDKRTRLFPQVKVGNKVLFRLGAEMDIEGKRYILVPEDALIAIIEN